MLTKTLSLVTTAVLVGSFLSTVALVEPATASTPSSFNTASSAEKTPTVLNDSFGNAGTLSYQPGESMEITGSFTPAADNRVVQLEKMNGNGSWNVISTQYTDPVDSNPDGSSGDITFFLDIPTGQSAQFRVHVLESDNAAEVIGGIKTVGNIQTTLTIKPTTVTTKLVDLASDEGFNISADVVAKDAGNEVALEKQNPATGSWAKLTAQSTGVSDSGVNQLDFTAPVENGSAGSYSYRLHSIAAGPSYKDSYTQAYTVSYEKTTTTITNSDLNGKTFSWSAAKTLTLSGKLNSLGDRMVYLQKYSNRVWVSMAVVHTEEDGSFLAELPADNTASWRFYVPATDKYTSAAGPSTIANRAIQKPTSVFHSGKTKQVPWQANTLTWSVGGPVGTHVQVQQYVSKKWKAVKNASIPTNSLVSYSVPKGSTKTASSVKQYRLFISPTAAGWSNAYSSVLKDTVENPNKYTGMAKTAYNYMKGQCPVQFIKISSTLYKNKKAWGLNYLNGNITLYSKIPAKHLRTVALHECGHSRQWSLYGSNADSWKTFGGQMNDVYGQKGSLGIEQNADCIANAWHKNSYYGYKGNCNGAKGAAGKALASNRKY